jgi:signal transduction histidine kinase
VRVTFVAVEPPSVRRLGIAVAVVLGALAVFVVLRQPADVETFGPPSDVVGVALVLLATLPLVMVDVRPRTAVLVSSVGVSGAMLTGHATTLEALALLIGVGLCAYRAGPPAAVIGVIAGMAGIALAPALAPSATPLASTLANGLLAVVAVVAGLGARAQRGYVIQLERQSRELEALRATEHREIIAQERLRIAREVHDVVGHALAAITLHARVGTRRLSRDPSSTARSLEEITELAAAALAETRDAVGQLRTADTADLHPRRGLDDLDDLVAAFRAADVSVTLRREGDGSPVPTVVQSAAYRIVQESLSNIARHVQPPVNAAVVLRREPQALLVDVSDDGAAPSEPGADGHGHGLAGMRERVSGLGGTLEAGPSPHGGWRVRATLPTGPVHA